MATQQTRPVPEPLPFSEEKLNEFMMKATGDMGAAMKG
jgi:hypothetical protein